MIHVSVYKTVFKPMASKILLSADTQDKEFLFLTKFHSLLKLIGFFKHQTIDLSLENHNEITMYDEAESCPSEEQIDLLFHNISTFEAIEQPSTLRCKLKDYQLQGQLLFKKMRGKMTKR